MRRCQGEPSLKALDALEKVRRALMKHVPAVGQFGQRSGESHKLLGRQDVGSQHWAQFFKRAPETRDHVNNASRSIRLARTRLAIRVRLKKSGPQRGRRNGLRSRFRAEIRPKTPFRKIRARVVQSLPQAVSQKVRD